MNFSQSTKIWVFSFIYTLGIGLFVQLGALKYIFPQWNAGSGMLIGLDAFFYHGVALSLYEQMLRYGWAAWQLFPETQVVSGISAIFYYLIAPKPWSVLPLNAVMNATACTTLFYLLTLISGDQKSSSLAILPFLLFPSALQWNAQLNNDVYSIPGVILFITGWAGMVFMIAGGWRKNLIHLGMILSGFGLIYLTRPYLGLPFIVISIVLFAVYCIKTIHGLIKSPRKSFWGVGWLLLMGLVVAGSLPLSQNGLLKGARWEAKNSNCSLPNLQPQCNWKISKWLPSSLDTQLRRLSLSRFANIQQWKNGNSNIDSNVVFYNSANIIKYIPRALQISFFAPFPNMWTANGSLPSSTLMRKVSGAEMLIVYFCIAGLIPGIYFFKNKGVFYLVILICVAFLLLYGLVAPNIGSLYRFRFPFLMSLVSIGLLSWLFLFQRIRMNKNSIPVQTAANRY